MVILPLISIFFMPRLRVWRNGIFSLIVSQIALHLLFFTLFAPDIPI